MTDAQAQFEALGRSLTALSDQIAEAARPLVKAIEDLAIAFGRVGEAFERQMRLAWRRHVAESTAELSVVEGIRAYGFRGWLRAQIDYMDLQVYGAFDED